MKNTAGLNKQENNEHTVIPMVQDKAQAAVPQKDVVEAIVTSLKGSVNENSDAAQGCIAMIFTVDLGDHTRPDYSAPSTPPASRPFSANQVNAHISSAISNL